MSKRRDLLPPRTRHTPPDMSLAIVNIVFLLLFFFLATGSLVSGPGVEVDLSTVTDLPVDVLPQPLLTVGPDGGLLLDGVPVAAEDLGPALSGLTEINILIDRTAPAQDLLGLLARPGFDALEIRLVTENRVSGQ